MWAARTLEHTVQNPARIPTRIHRITCVFVTANGFCITGSYYKCSAFAAGGSLEVLPVPPAGGATDPALRGRAALAPSSRPQGLFLPLRKTGFYTSGKGSWGRGVAGCRRVAVGLVVADVGGWCSDVRRRGRDEMELVMLSNFRTRH
eukprot:COSAG02_NODE_192_length_29942_cov_34.627228_16_plen_147_part_00